MTAARLSLAFALALCGGAFAQDRPLEVQPSVLSASQAATISLRAEFSYLQDHLSPEIVVEASRILVYLNAQCNFMCPPDVVRTYEVTVQGLAPGNYEVIAHRHARSMAPAFNPRFVGQLKVVAVEAAIEPDPIPAFAASDARLRIDGLPYYAGRGIPTADVNGNTVTVVLNSGCGLLCPGIVSQTFDVRLPPMTPGEYQVAIYGGDSPSHLVDATLKVAAGSNYQGLWWASPAGVESGWGLQIAHQGETMFATWYTYDRDGSASWFVMPDVQRAPDGVYAGSMYRTTAHASASGFNLVPSVGTSYEGTVLFQFNGPDDGFFSYEVDGQRHSKRITRQLFSPDPTSCGYGAEAPPQRNFQDLWWNAPAGSESGWGVQIAHQGDIIFATLFGYDAVGKGRWLVMPDGRLTAAGTYSGTVYSTRGPSYDANPWRREDVTVTPVGTAEFTFSGVSSGGFKISPAPGSSVSAQKSITRQIFSAYPTVCN